MPKLTPCPKCDSTDVWSHSLPGGMRTDCDGCGHQGPIRDTADQAQIVWLAQGQDNRVLAQLRQQNRALVASVNRLRDFIRDAHVSSGVCCCGEDMADHSHSPGCGLAMDRWDQACLQILEETSPSSLPPDK